MPTELQQALPGLDALDGVGPEAMGGKAWGLGRLVELGFRVPRGFVVPADRVASLDRGNLTAAVERLAGGRPSPRFAVRSSAAGEDSERASWAGQFDTRLDVPPDRVAEAVEACGASLDSERVRGYAADRGLDEPASMSVVVQEMVDAAKAGTIFTRGLASDDALVIEAVRGLGANLVGGEVTPERATVERDGAVRSVEPGEHDSPILDDAEIRALTTLGMEVESAFDRPMDVEWAIDTQGELFVLQARPVTAAASRADRPYARWRQDDLFRWGPTAGRYFYISDYVLAACEIASVAKGAALPWTVLTFDDTDQMVWLSSSSGWHGLAEHCFREVCLDDAAMASLRRRYDAACERLESFFEIAWMSLLREELAGLAARFYEAVHEFWLATLPAELGNYRGEQVLEEALREHVPHDAVRASVARMLFEHEGLSAEQRKRVELAEAEDVTAHWEAHRFDLSSYLGPHERSPGEFERERNALDGDAVAELRRGAQAADEARTRSVANLGIPERVQEIGRRLALTLAWQEERKRVSNRAMAVKGQLLARAAAILGSGEEALVCLGCDELLAALEGAEWPLAAAGRRPGVLFSTEVERLSASEARTLWLSLAHPPIEDPSAVRIEGGKVAFEAPAPITGVARVVTAVKSETEFREGDILIAPRTSPDFELLMRRAAAVVTATGGQTSHTAVFCRENSLPGVVGLPNATRLVRDGERVTVHAGCVDEPAAVYVHERD